MIAPTTPRNAQAIGSGTSMARSIAVTFIQVRIVTRLRIRCLLISVSLPLAGTLKVRGYCCPAGLVTSIRNLRGDRLSSLSSEYWMLDHGFQQAGACEDAAGLGREVVA